MPPVYTDEDIATRILRLTEDMGYVRGKGRLDLTRCNRVIRSRAGLDERQWPERRLERIFQGKRTPTTEDVKAISLGLGIDARVLLWGHIPPLPRRKARSLFDEVGPAT